MPEKRRVCWRSKEQLIQCIQHSTCFLEKGEAIPECLLIPECFLERKNWLLCKLTAFNPKYRLRGSPYDRLTEDQRKTEERIERIRREEAEERGV